MSLSNKNIQAILRNKKIKQEILNSDTLSLEDYINYESLNDDKMSEAYENIINSMEAFATEICYYQSPVEIFPDDAVLYGIRGFYIVKLQDDVKFFSSRKEAVKFADDVSSYSWELAKDCGWIE